MPNITTINITAAGGSHKVVVQQDANDRRTIDSSIDGKKHVLYECSTNSDGTVLAFKTDIHIPFWTFKGDDGTLVVDPATSTVALDIAKANVHYTGVLGAGEAAATVAFINACKASGLPDLAA